MKILDYTKILNKVFSDVDQNSKEEVDKNRYFPTPKSRKTKRSV